MYLYVIENCDDHRVKIGYSADPDRRCAALQTGSAGVLRVVHRAAVPADRVELLERQLHRDLACYRVRGEWFSISADQAALLLDHCVIRWLDDPLLG